MIQKNNGAERNILDRIAREVLENPKIKGVCIEAIMSQGLKEKFSDDWKEFGDNILLVKTEGGKSRRKTKRRKSRKRK